MDEEEQNRVIGVFRDPKEILPEYSIEKWLPSILNHTFSTKSFSMSLQTTEALVCIISSHWRSSNVVPTEEQLQLVGELEVRIHEMIMNVGGEAFVKLSTRSPKDAVFENKNPNVEKYLLEELEKLKKTKPIDQIDDNDELILLSRASTMALKVNSGKEAMALLSISDRVYSDLNKAIQITKESGKEDPGVQIFVRKWENFPIEMEFRGFVCKRKFTALSQYFHYVYFPELSEKKEEILQKIQELWETVREKIPQENYVIDFCILEDGTAKIIEINPFHYSTGAPFFSWKKGSPEREILLNGPFEFRIRECLPPPDTKSRYMIAYYEKFFKDVLGRVTPPKEEEGQLVEEKKEEDSICVIQ